MINATNQTQVLLEILFGAAGVALILGAGILIVTWISERRRKRGVPDNRR